MIIESHPYLLFDGCCLAALQRYRDIFKGEILDMKRMGDLKFPMPDDHKHRVLHATFKSQGLTFMASDSFPGHVPVQGNNISQVLSISEIDEAKKILSDLQDGSKGKLLMPLSQTQWSQGYARVVDAFGICWDIHVPKEA